MQQRKILGLLITGFWSGFSFKMFIGDDYTFNNFGQLVVSATFLILFFIIALGKPRK